MSSTPIQEQQIQHGEYTDCGCGIYLCKRYFTHYVDMSYHRLLQIATQRGYISHRDFPTFEEVIHILQNRQHLKK